MIGKVLTLALLAAAPGSALAAWDGDYETQSIVVPAGDLDLSTSAGIATLYNRVDRAVDRICGDDRDCREEAWASTEGRASAAIAHDKWMRRLAEERKAELAACGWRGCAPQPAYAPPPPYVPAPRYTGPRPAQTTVVAPGSVRVTVTITQTPPRIAYAWP